MPTYYAGELELSREAFFGRRHRRAVDPYRVRKGEERIATVRDGPRPGIKLVDFVIKKATPTPKPKLPKLLKKFAAKKPTVTKVIEKKAVTKKTVFLAPPKFPEAARKARIEKLKKEYIAKLIAEANKPKPPPPRIPARASIADLLPKRPTRTPTRTPPRKPFVREWVGPSKRITKDELEALADSYVPYVLSKTGITAWSVRLTAYGLLAPKTYFVPTLEDFEYLEEDTFDPFGTNEGVCDGTSIDFSKLAR